MTLLSLSLAVLLHFSASPNDGFERENGVVVVDPERFDETIAHFEQVLVEFYAPVRILRLRLLCC